MEFTRTAQAVADILFHSSIKISRSCWMLDTWCFSTFRLRMPYMCCVRSGDILGHSIAFTFSSKAVVILAVCLGWLCWKTVSEGGNHLLFQNVTVHVGIHVSLNEPQLPSTSSSHAAPDHDATTTMLDCRQGTIFLALLTRASPHMLDTIWAKQVYLRLIRPQDMVPVIHALGQVVFSKLLAFLWASFRRCFFLRQWACKPSCCSVWRMVWALKSRPFTSATSKAMLAALMHLFFEASFCTWHTARGLNHFDRPLIDPKARSEWNPSWKTSAWPWPVL